MTYEQEKLSIEAKLGLNTYKIAKAAHILPDQARCAVCRERWCLRICPGNLYSLGADGQIVLNYEGCLECGTCLVVCSHLTWEYPEGGCGVQYRLG
ncbi:MAG: ferredoxin family protein [Chloroflexota bacterium]|nr:MAG: ferredoxin family protein [Chloroflexota bacterium]